MSKWIEPFNPEMPSHLAERMAGQDVAVLICGAISEVPARLIETSGIKLIPFISGDAKKVPESYADGRPIIPEFLMPGCGKSRRKPCRKRSIHDGHQQNGKGPPEGRGTVPNSQPPGKGRVRE